jgi:hypothetical protein
MLWPTLDNAPLTMIRDYVISHPQVGVDTEKKEVQLQNGSSLKYNYLVSMLFNFVLRHWRFEQTTYGLYYNHIMIVNER